MARFNTASHAPRKGAGLASVREMGTNHEDSVGYRADAKTELFITAVTSLVENSFYESAETTKGRLATLAAEVAVADPQWFAEFVYWLRRGGNMRTASVLVAVAGTRAMQQAGIAGGRQVIAAAIDRADEPGEVIAAWRALYGRNIPTVVRKGITDAVNRVWTEYSVSKYDSDSAAFSLRDVMNLARPAMTNQPLAAYIMASAYDREVDLSALPMLAARAEFMALSADEQRARVLDGSYADAGLTWENVSSMLGKPDAAVWEALLPSMGYMARLRSLRRLEEANVSGKVLDELAAWLANPANVAKSRQLPLRFLSAFREVPSKRFEWPLEQAVNASLANIEALPGKTLVLVDRSASMHAPLSKHSKLSREDAANVFGAAIARRSEDATFVDFGETNKVIDFRKFKSVLEMANRPQNVGHSTMTATAAAQNFKDHDRVVILTDDQSMDGDPGAVVPANVPVYLWDLGGYEYGAFGYSRGKQFTEGPNRYKFGGLSDASFDAIRLIEAGRDQKWPWER